MTALSSQADRYGIPAPVYLNFGRPMIKETAEVLGVSPITVDKDWSFTRDWLKAKLDETDPGVGAEWSRSGL